MITSCIHIHAIDCGYHPVESLECSIHCAGYINDGSSSDVGAAKPGVDELEPLSSAAVTQGVTDSEPLLEQGNTEIPMIEPTQFSEKSTLLRKAPK